MVLRLAWHIQPIRFENSIRNRIGRPIRFEIRFERKKNDSQVPRSAVSLLSLVHLPAFVTTIFQVIITKMVAFDLLSPLTHFLGTDPSSVL